MSLKSPINLLRSALAIKTGGQMVLAMLTTEHRYCTGVFFRLSSNTMPQLLRQRCRNVQRSCPGEPTAHITTMSCLQHCLKSVWQDFQQASQLQAACRHTSPAPTHQASSRVGTEHGRQLTG